MNGGLIERIGVNAFDDVNFAVGGPLGADEPAVSHWHRQPFVHHESHLDNKVGATLTAQATTHMHHRAYALYQR